ncbi:MAG TPA: hypothetical protein GX503_04970 [Clostridiales bacterium]|nr:hypothetical protein [Clostridiales bacterium]
MYERVFLLKYDKNRHEGLCRKEMEEQPEWLEGFVFEKIRLLNHLGVFLSPKGEFF